MQETGNGVGFFKLLFYFIAITLVEHWATTKTHHTKLTSFLLTMAGQVIKNLKVW